MNYLAVKRQMPEWKNMNKLGHKQKTIIFVMIFLLLIIIPLGFIYNNWNNNYRNKINPGIQIGSISLSGLTLDQAEIKIDDEANRLESTGIIIAYGNKQVSLPSIISVNSDLSFPVFIYNREETLKRIADASPKDSFISYLTNYLRNSFSDRNIPMSYSLDKERAKAFIIENLKDVEVAPENATFTVKKNTDYSVSFIVEPEKIGRKIDFDLAFGSIEESLKYLSVTKVNLKTITARPLVRVADLESLKPEAEALVSRGNLTLTATTSTSTTWIIKKETLASWITSEGELNNFHLSIDQNKIITYLKDRIAPDIDQEAKTPKYVIKDGKMSSWQTGSDGQKLNLENSAAKIKEQYLINKVNQVDLVTDIIKSQITENTDELNIQELLGTGHSNFTGSPANRRHNIQVGADAVNGMLIAPGEEFSLVKTLGDIDASTGYLPELVIKNNKTIPEYGGGLCQVATTVFRSALVSGLPITARQNHSYRVSYYEPAGTDAAVYDPWPDMRFLNDTGNYILIQSRIVKNDIYFDFWGKKDGRLATSTKPTIYNITKPAPAKLIETTDLKPGEKKCTEHAHNGADAYFDYSVTYTSGDTKSTRFKSHYVPWQEVCLIGKSATSTPIINSSTSTPSTN
jgi:vancomycin resistance protein YoaR